jgi:hypothetical protein
MSATILQEPPVVDFAAKTKVLTVKESPTDFVKLVRPGKGDTVASINGGNSILLSPKISPAVEAPIQWLSPLNQVGQLKSMVQKARVRPPEVRSAEPLEAQEFKTTRKYDGVIFKRDENSFWARLRQTPDQFPTLEVEFDLNDLTASDKPLAVEGTPIVWTLGSGRDNGTWKKASIVYVRRLLPASKEELDKSHADVREMMSGIKWK